MFMDSYVVLGQSSNTNKDCVLGKVLAIYLGLYSIRLKNHQSLHRQRNTSNTVESNHSYELPAVSCTLTLK